MVISEERKAWLASLKDGDQVAVNKKTSYMASALWKIYTIRNRTPKGLLRLNDGGDRGQLLKADGAWSDNVGYYKIEPLTPEIEEIVHRERMIKTIQGTKWTTLPTDVLEHIESWILFQEERQADGTVS